MKKFLFINFLCLVFVVFTNTAKAQAPGDVVNGCCFWLEQIDQSQVIVKDGLDDWNLSKFHLNPIIKGPDGNYGTADDNFGKAEYYYFRFINCLDAKTKLSIDWEFLLNGVPHDKPLDATSTNMKNFMNVEIEWLLPLIDPAKFHGSGPLLSGMGLESKITPPYTTINNVKRAVVTDFPGQIDTSPYGSLFGYFNPYGVQNRWYNYIYADFLEWACANNYLRVKITRYTSSDVQAQFKLRERKGGVDFQEWFTMDEEYGQHDYMGGHGATVGKLIGNFWLHKQDYDLDSDSTIVCGSGEPFDVEFNGETITMYPPDPYPVYPEPAQTTTYNYPIFNEEYLEHCGVEYLETIVALTVVWQPAPPVPAKDSIHLCGPGMATLSVPDPDPTLTYNWYLGKNLNFKIHTGTTFTFPCLVPNLTYTLYVTSNAFDCESAATPYVVRVDRQVRARMHDATECPTAEPTDVCRTVHVHNGYGNYTYAWSNNVSHSDENEGCVEMLGNCDEEQTISVEVTDVFSGCTATASATITIEDGTVDFDLDDIISINSEEGSLTNMYTCTYDADPEIIGGPIDIDISCGYAEGMLDISYEDGDPESVNCVEKVVYSFERTWTITTYCGNSSTTKAQTINVLDVDAPHSARTSNYRIQTIYGTGCAAVIPNGTVRTLKDSLQIYDNCTDFESIEVSLGYFDGDDFILINDGDVISFIGNQTPYFAQATDACRNSRPIRVYFNQPPPPFSVDIIPEEGTALCNDGEQEFDLEAIIIDGPEGMTYQYEWGFVSSSCADCSGNEEPNGTSTFTATPTTDLEDAFTIHYPKYYVVVTDLNGCQATDSIDLTLLPLPDFSYEKTNAQYCDDIIIRGSIYLYPNTYAYKKDDVPFNGTTVSNLVAGDYVITAVNTQTHCEYSKTITIRREDIDFTVTATIEEGDEIKCYGGNALVTITPDGGLAPFKFYRNGVKFYEGEVGTIELPIGSYEFTVRDENGCEATGTIDITDQPDSLIAYIDLVDTIKCFGLPATLRAYATGGTEPYSFLWNTDETTQTIDHLVAGTYTVIVSDANDCPVATESYTVETPTQLSATIALVDTIKCFGDETGKITVTPSGGTSPYTYLWSTTETTATIQNLGSDYYSVTVTDANGCEIIIDDYYIEQPEELEARISLEATNRCFDDAAASITASAIGGTPPYTFEWDNGAITATISDLGIGKYFVTITDANGCFDTASFRVIAPDTLRATIALTDTIKCNGAQTGSLEVTGTGGIYPYTYLWSNGETTRSISGLPAGPYSVTLSDANGCAITENFVITQPRLLVASITLVDSVRCFGEETAILTASASGGTLPYSFSWSTGSTTATIYDLGADTYTVTVTDANNCPAEKTISVEEPDTLTFTFTGTPKICVGDGNIYVTPNGGTAPYTFSWSNDATTDTITNLNAGEYTVTVTDDHRCTATDTYTISYFTNVTPLNVSGFKGCNDNAVAITLNIGVETGKSADVTIKIYGYIAERKTATIIATIDTTIADSGSYTFYYNLTDVPTCAFSGINYLYFVASALVDICTFESEESESVNYTNAPTLYVYENARGTAAHDPYDNTMGGGEDGNINIPTGSQITHYFRVDDFCKTNENINLSIQYTYYYADENGNKIEAAPITQYLSGSSAGFMRFYTPMTCGTNAEINYSNVTEKSYFPYRTTVSGWYYYGAYYDYFKLPFIDDKEIRVVLSGFSQPGTYIVEYALVTHHTASNGCFYGTPVTTTCSSKTIGGYNFYTPGYKTIVLATNTMTIVVDGTPQPIPAPTPSPAPIQNTRVANVDIYPNPANDNITLSFEEMDGDAQLSIVNLTGSVVLEKLINVDRKTVNIELPSLQAGFYFVYIKSNDAVIVRKLVIEQR